MMQLSPEDRYDIEHSFHVLDDERIGMITMDQFYTLWLGLGYDPSVTQENLAAILGTVTPIAVTVTTASNETTTPNNNQSQLEQQQHQQLVTLDDVLRTISIMSKSRNRESELRSWFQLLAGRSQENKPRSEVITASDLWALAKEMGDSLSEEEAHAMMGDQKCWELDDFRVIMTDLMVESTIMMGGTTNNDTGTMCFPTAITNVANGESGNAGTSL